MLRFPWLTSLFSGRSRKAVHRRPTVQTSDFPQPAEILESRLLLTIALNGPITTNMTLSDTSQPYCVTSDLVIESGVTLTISPGVEINTQDSSDEIRIDGILNASMVNFTGATEIIVNSGGRLDVTGNSTINGGFVEFAAGSVGTVTGSEFGSAQLRLRSNSVSISGNTFTTTTPVLANPDLVSEVTDNTFQVPATIDVSGTVAQDETWQPVTNMSRVRAVGDVVIDSGRTLTIAAQMQVNTQDTSDEFRIDGVLDATDVDFTGVTEVEVNSGGRFDMDAGSTIAGTHLRFNPGSLGDVNGSTFTSARLILQNSGVTIDNNTFTLGTPAVTRPDLVSELYDNTFQTDAIIDVIGTVTQNETWQPMTNLSRIRVIGDVNIDSGRTLTVAANIEINTDSSADEIRVSGVLDATDVDFTGETEVIVNDGGRFDLNTGSTVAGNFIAYTAGSLGTVQGNSFTSAVLDLKSSSVEVDGNTFQLATPVEARPDLVSELYDNTFQNTTTSIDVTGDVLRNETWQPTGNLKQVRAIGDVRVTAGQTLTIAPTMEVNTDSSADEFFIDGVLDASGVTFTGVTEMEVRNGGRLDLDAETDVSGSYIEFNTGSLGNVHCSTLSVELRIEDDSTATVVNNDLTDGTIVSGGSSSGQVDLRNNFWGSTNTTQIASMITDNADNSNLPTVLFNPFLSSFPPGACVIPPPNVTVAVSPATVAEDGTGTMDFAFTRTGDMSSAITVNFTVGGDATFNTDYTQTGATAFAAATGSVTIPANTASITVAVDPSADTTVESNETVSMTVAAGTGYTIGSPAAALGTISNDDAAPRPVVTVTAAPSSVAEDGGGNLVYTFTRDLTAGTLTAGFSVGGAAMFATDYTQTGAATFAAGSGTVTFADGAATAVVTIAPTTDAVAELDETAVLTLTTGTDYLVGSANSATGTITNDDAAGFTVSKTTATVSEDGTTVVDAFTVVLTAEPTSNVVLDLSLSANPDAAVDQTSLTFTSTNWNVAQTVSVTGTADDVVDASETTTITVAVNDGASADAYDALADQTVTVTTTDDDTAGFTLNKTTATVSEDGTTVVDAFTVVLTSEPTSDVVLDLSLSANPDAAVDQTSLTFTSTNWNVAQTVNVTGTDDAIVDGDETTTITVAVNDASSDDVYDALADQTVTVTTTDDDGGSQPQFAVADLDGSGGVPDQFTDGVLMLGYLGGLTSAAQIQPLLPAGATLADAQVVVDRLTALTTGSNPAFDVDQSGGVVDQFTDGILLLAYFSGLRQSAQLAPLVVTPPATIAAAAITANMDALFAIPATTQSASSAAVFSAPVTAAVLSAAAESVDPTRLNVETLQSSDDWPISSSESDSAATRTTLQQAFASDDSAMQTSPGDDNDAYFEALLDDDELIPFS